MGSHLAPHLEKTKAQMKGTVKAPLRVPLMVPPKVVPTAHVMVALSALWMELPMACRTVYNLADLRALHLAIQLAPPSDHHSGVLTAHWTVERRVLL